MNIDFTIRTYRKFLSSIAEKGYDFQTVEQYAAQPKAKAIILRHDVDRLPKSALAVALIEHELGIHGTYYFRMILASYNKAIIRQIADLGHEIGYHYEDLAAAGGQIDKAYDLFCRNLEAFRKLYPVKTICMHGSPLSRWDSRDIWHQYDYRKLGIICEPYFDIDFSKVMYLTDTGRRWNGEKVSIRDKTSASDERYQKLKLRTTFDIIFAAQNGKLPDQIMITIHPQRWTNNPVLWARELLLQNIKNAVKQFMVKHPLTYKTRPK